MQKLPVDLIRNIIQNVDPAPDLVSLSLVCRSLHSQAIQFIYEEVTVDLHDLYTPKHSLSRSQGPLPACVEQLQGIARNSQAQCQYVRKLSVVNRSDLPAVANPPRVYFGLADDLDRRNGTQSFVNFLLEMALQKMERLSEFEWLAIAYPSNAMFSALSRHQLRSLTYRHPVSDALYLEQFRDAIRPIRDYPSEYDPDTRIIDTGNLTSLSLYNLGTTKTANDAAELTFRLRKQLKTLRLSVASEWQPKIETLQSSPEFMEAVMIYDRECTRDKLYPFIYPFVLADKPEPMRLQELELYGVFDAFDKNNWLCAFDLHTIQKLTLMHYFDCDIGTGDSSFWSHLQSQAVSFKTFKTDCGFNEMFSFLQSSSGLEALFLYDYNRSLRPITLSGHFHSLRKLFYPEWSIRPSHTTGSILEMVVTNCPLLEELGTYLVEQDSYENSFRALDDSPCLKRLYVTSAITADDRHLGHNSFLQLFFDYFGSRKSPFFNRLELLSYDTALWQIVSTELNDAEREDMELELEHEPLSDGELEGLSSSSGHSHESTQAGNIGPPKEDHTEVTDDYEDDTDDLQLANDFRQWLTQPECYTWERVRSGFSRMPLKTLWVHYRNDELVWTVYEFVIGREPVFRPEQSATPSIHDWTDASDEDQSYAFQRL